MACCILLDISSVFCKSIIFRILAIIFVRFGFLEVFRAFFLHVLRYQFETWYIHAVGGSPLSAFMALKIISRPQIWYTPLYCECLDPYWFSSWLGNFWPSGGQKHLKGGVTRAPSQRKVFRTFFVHVVRYQFETWHIHLVGGVTRQVRVSFQSGHVDLFYSPK